MLNIRNLNVEVFLWFKNSEQSNFGREESFAKLNEVTKMQLTIHREHYEIDQNNSKLPDLKCDLNELPKVNKIFDDMKSLSEKIEKLKN